MCFLSKLIFALDKPTFALVELDHQRSAAKTLVNKVILNT